MRSWVGFNPLPLYLISNDSGSIAFSIKSFKACAFISFLGFEGLRSITPIAADAG